MKSLLREPKSREDTYVMEDEQTQRLLGEMQSDIRHLQSDVTDIKADQRIRFDKIDARFEKVDERFDKIDARFEKVDENIDARFEKTDDRFRSIEKDLGAIKDALASAKVWAIGLYIALAGTMLYVMARGFKWL
jgi:peptidoglycan hydrolase CwlO-like protein